MKVLQNNCGRSYVSYAIAVNDPSVDCVLVNHLTDDYGVLCIVKMSLW